MYDVLIYTINGKWTADICPADSDDPIKTIDADSMAELNKKTKDWITDYHAESMEGWDPVIDFKHVHRV